jgi:hypothetical protein
MAQDRRTEKPDFLVVQVVQKIPILRKYRFGLCNPNLSFASNTLETSNPISRLYEYVQKIAYIMDGKR